jgi:hypothetical protein
VREPLDELLALADEVEEEESASDERRQGDHCDPERPRGEPFDLTGLERLELDEEPARTGRRRTAVTVSPEKASVPPRLRWRTARIPRWPPEVLVVGMKAPRRRTGEQPHPIADDLRVHRRDRRERGAVEPCRRLTRLELDLATLGIEDRDEAKPLRPLLCQQVLEVARFGATRQSAERIVRCGDEAHPLALREHEPRPLHRSMDEPEHACEQDAQDHCEHADGAWHPGFPPPDGGGVGHQAIGLHGCGHASLWVQVILFCPRSATARPRRAPGSSRAGRNHAAGARAFAQSSSW